LPHNILYLLWGIIMEKQIKEMKAEEVLDIRKIMMFYFNAIVANKSEEAAQWAQYIDKITVLKNMNFI
jgi:hypothetical protein